MDARLKTPDYELRWQASGMTEKTTVRSQLLVNFNINIVIIRKVADCQALKLLFTIFANRRITLSKVWRVCCIQWPLMNPELRLIFSSFPRIRITSVTTYDGWRRESKKHGYRIKSGMTDNVEINGQDFTRTRKRREIDASINQGIFRPWILTEISEWLCRAWRA